MKYLLFLAAWLLGWQSYVLAQDQAKFSITIMDASQISAILDSGALVYPVFANPAINQVLEDYQIYRFELAYPAARLSSMRRIWLVECNDLGLMQELLAVDSLLFPAAQEELEPELTYSPNDYGLSPQVEGQKDLDLIRAKQAWDITKGNPSVVVGITDTQFDVTHEDLINKIVNIRSNYHADPRDTAHGTLVAGALAAETDNSKGIASIGFNCRLDISSARTLNQILQMSREGIRVVNNSWFIDCNINQNHKITSALAYENGATVVFGAGNGYKIERRSGLRTLIRNHCNLEPTYPPSYPHNISVSSVGCDKAYGQKSFWTGLTDSIYWNMADVHENVVGSFDTIDIISNWGHPAGTVFPLEVHNHNSAVDLVAPGYTVRTTNPGGGYRTALGTSFAAPLVSGTAALMLSAQPCLSPYQVEFGLKHTAVNIDAIPENVPYAGKLGFGRLDAGAAVAWAANHNCNSITTSTLFIRGIEINTICRPGQSSNNVNPVLTPIVERGQGPYTYEWIPLAGNQTTLDAYNVANPQVTSSWGQHRLAYHLMVYDNSQIQKVASKQIELILSSTASYDLALRDSYMDMLNEPNNQIALDPRAWDIWQSPDIWNRQQQDSVLWHENPEYSATLPNYVYARVRNVGCVSSPADSMMLRLYWTKASTGENWDWDWTTTDVMGTNGLVAGGREITASPNAPINLPAIAPGGEFIVSLPWYPVKPQDYAANLRTVDVCFLARITETAVAPYGMASPEVARIRDNVLNNNNIATRNFIVTNFSPNKRNLHQVLVGNAEPAATRQAFDLQLINERSINPHFSEDIGRVGQITVFLDEVYDLWVAGGAQGSYGSVNEAQKSVSFDGSSPLVLKNIEFDGGERLPVLIAFEGNSEQSEIPLWVHFRQFLHNEDYETTTPYGNVSFELRTENLKQAPANKPISELSTSQNYSAYPNPTTERLSLQYLGKTTQKGLSWAIYDLSGRVLDTQQHLSLNQGQTLQIEVKDYPPGLYILQITEADGHREQLKFVKQ